MEGSHEDLPIHTVEGQNDIIRCSTIEEALGYIEQIKMPGRAFFDVDWTLKNNLRNLITFRPGEVRPDIFSRLLELKKQWNICIMTNQPRGQQVGRWLSRRLGYISFPASFEEAGFHIICSPHLLPGNAFKLSGEALTEASTWLDKTKTANPSPLVYVGNGPVDLNLFKQIKHTIQHEEMGISHMEMCLLPGDMKATVTSARKILLPNSVQK